MKKQILSIVLALAMLFSLMPTTAFAASSECPFVVTGGRDYDYTYSKLHINGAGSYTISMQDGVTSTRSPVIINSTGDLNLTLKGVNIDRGNDFPALQISENAGNVTIILEGTNRLISSGSFAGLQKDSGNDSRLTIQGSGSLYAEGGDGNTGGGAGIGGGNGKNGCNITISGGTVEARGGGGGAGIGGGNGKDGRNITISGGTVEARGFGGGAGIGGGNDGDGYNITINGGSVRAIMGGIMLSAGIGGGSNGIGQHIAISGDTTNVYAFGAVGIGGGVATSSAGGGSGQNITIAGGTVSVLGVYLGIGGLGLAKDITISGGNVTTTPRGGYMNLSGGGLVILVNTPIAIGGGDAENITISGGTVDADGCIGGAWSAKNIHITGGTVTARGKTEYMYTFGGLGDPVKISLPGIGGGKEVSGYGGWCDTIEISGGTVYAWGAGNSAGIGSAEGADAKNITISGGTVTAVSGYNGPAIGAGKGGTNTNNIIKPQSGQFIHAWSSQTETTPATAIFSNKLLPINTEATEIASLGNHPTVKLMLDRKYMFLTCFNTNGIGTAPQSRYLYLGDPRGLPTGMAADGTLITGWYEDSSCTKPFGINNFTSDITLYTNPSKMDLLFTDGNGNALLPGTGGYSFESGTHTFVDAGEVSVRMAEGAASTNQCIGLGGNTNLSLNSVHIESNDNAAIVAVPAQNGSIRLTLKGSSTLKSTNNVAIGSIFSNGTFIIDGDGSLLAISEGNKSAIGSFHLLLQGGTITAYGGEGNNAIFLDDTNKLAPSAGQAFTVTEVPGMSGNTPTLSEQAFLENIASETAVTAANELNKRGLQIRFHERISSFANVSATLGEDISLTYYITKGEFETAPRMRFTINGSSVIVNGVAEGDALYAYKFTGIAPQWMGDSITAELLSDDDTVIETKEYSVKQYLDDLKGETQEQLGYTAEKYNALQTLIRDLLVYGGAAQVFTNYKTEALVSNGVTGSGRKPADKADFSLTNDQTYVDFTGATVNFNNINRLKILFTAVSTEGLALKYKIGDSGEWQNIAYSSDGEGGYVITTQGISASKYTEKYTFAAFVGEDQGATLTYSINCYAYSMKNSSNDAMAALALATYNYGVSAKEYVVAE